MSADPEHLALAVRAQLAPKVGVTDRLPFTALRQGIEIDTRAGRLMVRARGHGGLSPTMYAVTAFALERDEAWIFMNSAAWDEHWDDVPRTRFTMAHEIGHVVLHAEELDELEVDAEPDHHERLDKEANLFAAHLLAPNAGLRRLHGEALRLNSIMQRFGMTAMAAERRLREWAAP